MPAGFCYVADYGSLAWIEVIRKASIGTARNDASDIAYITASDLYTWPSRHQNDHYVDNNI
jgi:hypothetical protein